MDCIQEMEESENDNFGILAWAADQWWYNS